MASESASKVCAVVLAAGESRRLGRPKQLLKLDGTELVAHFVERALASSIDGVVVVTGAHRDAVESAIEDLIVTVVFNPDFAEGQGTSLVAGIRALPDDVGAVIVLLGDMPGISTDVISRLADLWREKRPVAAIARYRSGRGHPVLFDRELLSELQHMTGDEGARKLLKRLGDRVVEEHADADSLPQDVDTEEDWERLQRNWQR
ncbi:nucleotidyltransferase family protein [soil metagenome]